jgi:multicomponent K+:H+ antiporter subunit D
MPAAAVTMVLGMIGVVAARSLGQQASFAALGSMGTLLIAVAGFTAAAESAAIYYMIHSTLAMAALFLLIDSVVIRRPGFGDELAPAPRIVHGGLIGAMFFLAVIAVIGMPPLSGFVGKLLILDAVKSLYGWGVIWAMILATSLLGLVGFASSGSILFWKSGEVAGELTPLGSPPIALPMVAIGSLLVLLIFLTGAAGPVTAYLDATAAQLFEPRQYIEAVLRPAGVVTK